MKKFLITLLFITMIILSGCEQKTAGDPKMVLSDFFDALAKKDITEAKKLTTEDSEPMMNMAQMAMQKIPDDDQILQYRKENIELEDAVITEDIATVPVKDKRTGETIDFTLKKEKSQWKVSINISTLLQIVQKKMKEHGMNGMNDSLESLNNGTHSKDDIEKAQKMIDSIKKVFDNRK